MASKLILQELKDLQHQDPPASCTTGELLKQLDDGSATFELVVSKDYKAHSLLFASLSSAFFGKEEKNFLCFAKVGSAQQGTPPAAKKIEHYCVHKVAGDGRCMFRALVLGMSTNKGTSLSANEEQYEADKLRMAVRDAICNSEKQRKMYEEALIAITVEESLNRYCRRILNPNFWGGESELLVLSRMCSQPIIVYIPESEAKRGKWASGFIPIAEYGLEFMKSTKERKARKPVRLLYSGGNHYDLLL